MILLVSLVIWAACDAVQNTDTDMDQTPMGKKTVLPTGLYQVTDSATGIARYLGADTVFYLNPEPVVSASDFDTAMVEQAYPGKNVPWIITVLLTDAGRKALSDATEKLIGQDVAIIINDTLFTTPPRLRARILSGTLTISRKGMRSKQDAEAVLAKIKGL